MSLGETTNEISDRLADQLGDGWAIEAEGDSVGRAYHPDPTDASVSEEEVVSVEIRTDMSAPFTIQTTAHNEVRGMGDLRDILARRKRRDFLLGKDDSATASTLDEALSAATTLASEVKEV